MANIIIFILFLVILANVSMPLFCLLVFFFAFILCLVIRGNLAGIFDSPKEKAKRQKEERIRKLLLHIRKYGAQSCFNEEQKKTGAPMNEVKHEIAKEILAYNGKGRYLRADVELWCEVWRKYISDADVAQVIEESLTSGCGLESKVDEMLKKHHVPWYEKVSILKAIKRSFGEVEQHKSMSKKQLEKEICAYRNHEKTSSEGFWSFLAAYSLLGTVAYSLHKKGTDHKSTQADLLAHDNYADLYEVDADYQNLDEILDEELDDMDEEDEEYSEYAEYDEYDEYDKYEEDDSYDSNDCYDSYDSYDSHDSYDNNDSYEDRYYDEDEDRY